MMADKVHELLLQLFEAIASTLLEQWSHSAECVVALAPCLFELYSASHRGRTKDTPTSSQVQQMILVSKLLFMLSKEAVNDSAFCNVQFVEAALDVIAKTSESSRDPKAKKKRVNAASRERSSSDQEDPLQLDSALLVLPTKVLIYIAGTLKNTSNAEDKMLKLLATNGAIAILSDTLRWRASDSLQAKEVAQFLIQTTGVLRNLSITKSYHKQFLEAQILVRLCLLVPAFLGHMELMGNVSRILSKLTLHEQPRAQINQNMVANMRNLMAVVDGAQNESLSFSEQQRPETRFQDILLIRMFFVLGNLCAGNDRNRVCIAFDCRGGIDVLLHALQFYARQYTKFQQQNSEAPDELDEAKSGEVLVKLVRVLANLAINAEVGAKLNSCSSQMSILLETLDLAQRNGDEELMLNIVSCITNLSYYSSSGQVSTGTSFIEGNRLEITSLLSKILLDRNEEAVVEAARAFGNLTRFKDVLAYVSEHKVLDCFVVLLDHSNREVVYTVCGVLMNAALDEPTRQQLLRVQLESLDADGDDRSDDDANRGDVRTLLLGIVECAATDDVDMTCIACKVLYNLLLPADGKATKHSWRSEVAPSECRTFDSSALRQVVQQIASTMDAHDARRTASRRQKMRADQRKGATRRTATTTDDDDSKEDVDDEAEKEDAEPSGEWRELRLVLSQLLRSAAPASCE